MHNSTAVGPDYIAAALAIFDAVAEARFRDVIFDPAFGVIAIVDRSAPAVTGDEDDEAVFLNAIDAARHRES